MIDLESILNQCKKNNRNAQAVLYNWLSPKLLGVCIRYMQDRMEAEDVMQDTFVRIFGNLEQFKGQGSFEGWCRRIAANMALTALKKRKRISFDRNLEAVELIDFEKSDTEQWDIEFIMACLNKLSVGYRTIINLFLIEEFSHKEIADQLAISESTSRSQYSRARQALIKLLKEHEETFKVKHL